MAELPRLFPYSPGDGVQDTLPFPSTPDPTGAAAAVLEFLSEFSIPEGRRQGAKIAGSDVPPFIARAISTLVGHRDADGARIIRSAMFCAPRKSMKSYLAALVAIAFLFSSQENNGEILIVASSQKQARRTFEMVCSILRSNQKYWQRLRVQDVSSKLTNLATGTTLSAMASDPAKLYGLSPSVLILDELHTWVGEKGQKLWTSLTTGQGARAQPLRLLTTTVADDVIRDGDVFMDQLRYFEGVAAGTIDDRRCLPMLWLTKEDADVHDPAVWAAANPGLGYSIDATELQEDYARSKTSDAGLAGFKTMRLNQIATSSLNRGWFTPAQLTQITGPVSLERIAECGRISIGLDYGGAYDLASAVIVGEDNGELFCMQRSWICHAGAERIQKDFPILKQMIACGELTVSGGSAVAAETVIADVVELAQFFDLSEIALDPAMSQHLAAPLADAGIATVEAKQGGMAMAAPMALLEEAVAQDRLHIGDDKLFAWNFGNVGQLTSNMGRRPIKIGEDSSANTAKIDCISALLSALQLVQEARHSEATGSGPQTDWYSPWLDPVNSQALLGGGVAVDLMFDPQPHPATGGIIVYAGF